MNKSEEQELAEQFLKGMVNLRNITLKSKPHIKKYLKIREIHNEICQSMLDYFLSGKYDFEEELKKATPSILKELNNNISIENIYLTNLNDEYKKLIRKIPNFSEVGDFFSSDQTLLEARTFFSLAKRGRESCLGSLGSP